MRTHDEIKKIILDKANTDSRIRAVLLNGSRANSKQQPDRFQDYDVMYIVDQMESFIADQHWISIFGDKLIWQKPDEMNSPGEGLKKSFSFHYLMLFKDGNRIDLTLFPAERFKTDFSPDSQTILWLDKDKLFENIGPASDRDYWIKPPTEKEFTDACNEFWWVSTYIAKGLLRDDISYAKAMMEGPVRKIFMKMTEWHIGTKTKFSVSLGKDGRNMRLYLSMDQYITLLKTYPDYRKGNIWNSLFGMAGLLKEFAIGISEQFNFKFNQQEQDNTIDFLREQFKLDESITKQVGKTISLIPLEEKYLDELLSFSSDPVIWEHLPLEIYTKEEMMNWYCRTMEEAALGNVFPFLIQKRQTLEIIGTTRIFDLDVPNKRAEIGMTWINPIYFGTKINTEAKLLLMTYAFDELKLNRVQFRSDERNIRSQRAILKLGASFEGILRNFKQRRDGSIGNSYLYSIISPEWETIEEDLRNRIG
jgi:aminoglycoside 6-adenylyltransferase